MRIKCHLAYWIDSLLHQIYQVFARRSALLLTINIQEQSMSIHKDGEDPEIFAISSGKNGTGETVDTGKTPRGWFQVDQLFGDNMPDDTYFVARKAKGSYHNNPSIEDPILARILWLKGIQWCNQNTLSRYIYLHGTNDIANLGKEPQSFGCIRLSPENAITVYNIIQKNRQSGRRHFIYIYDNDHLLPWQKNSPDLIG